jgi:hypothetical protein
MMEAVRFVKDRLGVEMAMPRKEVECEFYGLNRECRKIECRFYPLEG